jgi:hypothetical protein
VRIFKNKWFAKFAKRERISDSQLCKLVKEIEKGLIDVNYGDGVIKQRLARVNQGKANGYRCIVLFRYRELSILVYGFPKNECSNISQNDEQEFKKLAQEMLSLSEDEISGLIQSRELVEVLYHEKE